MQQVLRRWREDGPDFARHNSGKNPNVEMQLQAHQTRNTPEAESLSTHRPCILVDIETVSEREESDCQTQLTNRRTNKTVESSPRHGQHRIKCAYRKQRAENLLAIQVVTSCSSFQIGGNPKALHVVAIPTERNVLKSVRDTRQEIQPSNFNVEVSSF
ncbi:hypothetical protein MHU86_14596 [Fragilaria crotonensis]|nr:hypothetical protein MHU86_14596 [Fragilaria crotonensis]